MQAFIATVILAFGLSSPVLASLLTQASETASPSRARDFQDIENRIKARNFARRAAEKANGGLEKYRAERAMYEQQIAPVIDTPEYWVYLFRGGPPGAATPTIESEVRVDKANFKTTILYNGPIRSASTPPSPSDSAITPELQDVGSRVRARNVARQAAEKANGGLEKYQAEGAMSSQAMAPVIDNAEFWVFVFRGGPPGFTAPSLETEVQVNKADFKTTVLYNGPIRSANAAQPQTRIDPRMDALIRATEGRSRARRLARQAAEKANGGLEKYRAEQGMYDQTLAPSADTADYWIFTFRGGTPDSTTPTIESEVKVDKADFKTTMVYNGPLRSVAK